MKIRIAQSKHTGVHWTTKAHVLLDAAKERVTSALGVTLGLRACIQTRNYKDNPTATPGWHIDKYLHLPGTACPKASQSTLCTTSVHPRKPSRHLHRSRHGTLSRAWRQRTCAVSCSALPAARFAAPSPSILS